MPQGRPSLSTTIPRQGPGTHYRGPNSIARRRCHPGRSTAPLLRVNTLHQLEQWRFAVSRFAPRQLNRTLHRGHSHGGRVYTVRQLHHLIVDGCDLLLTARPPHRAVHRRLATTARRGTLTGRHTTRRRHTSHRVCSRSRPSTLRRPPSVGPPSLPSPRSSRSDRRTRRRIRRRLAARHAAVPLPLGATAHLSVSRRRRRVRSRLLGTPSRRGR